MNNKNNNKFDGVGYPHHPEDDTRWKNSEIYFVVNGNKVTLIFKRGDGSKDSHSFTIPDNTSTPKGRSNE